MSATTLLIANFSVWQDESSSSTSQMEGNIDNLHLLAVESDSSTFTFVISTPFVATIASRLSLILLRKIITRPWIPKCPDWIANPKSLFRWKATCYLMEPRITTVKQNKSNIHGLKTHNFNLPFKVTSSNLRGSLKKHYYWFFWLLHIITNVSLSCSYFPAQINLFIITFNIFSYLKLRDNPIQWRTKLCWECCHSTYHHECMKRIHLNLNI